MYRYYADNLSAERLSRAYEVAPSRVKQYLRAEIEHVLTRIRVTDRVVELGCGYGRVLGDLARHGELIAGIDTSLASLMLARRSEGLTRAKLVCMDAARTAFPDRTFDCVVCIQNGISAFHVDRRRLVLETVRIARGGGRVLFSTYSQAFWPDRLEWFRLQAAAGLLGEIDEERTGDGVIVCKDGFTATTVSADEFRYLTQGLEAEVRLEEVDESSLFCEIVLPGT